MAKRPIQLRLFEISSLHVEPEVKIALGEGVEESELSRSQVVDKMNETARRHGIHLVKGSGGLTVATLEKWLNPNDSTHCPSLKALMVACAVMKGSALRILNTLARPLGLLVIDERDKRLLEWAREYQKARESQRRMRRLAAELKEEGD